MVITDVPPRKSSVDGNEDHKPRLPKSLLFVCGKKSIRSPIAELLARQALPPDIYVASAGVKRGERGPFVDAFLQEEGLALDNRQPRGLE